MRTIARQPLSEEAISGAENTAEYDRYAGIYMQPEYRYFVKKILGRGFKTGRVLDVGTGSGRLAVELVKKLNKGISVTGIDLSFEMLQKAGVKASQTGLTDCFHLVQSSADSLPFESSSFDLVISYASLHLWREPERVIDEILRVLKPNGRLIIRDNRRIDGLPFWETFVRLIGLLMTRKRYRNWRKVILSSYTVSEVEAMLRKTGLTYYRAGVDFVKFDLCIEAVKNEFGNVVQP
jgi:ubiquinone/menaquinone biosynthesis C-methylase UbiE